MGYIDQMQQRAMQELPLYAHTADWLIHVFTAHRGQASNVNLVDWSIPAPEPVAEKLSLAWPEDGWQAPEYPLVRIVAYIVAHLHEVTVVDLARAVEPFRQWLPPTLSASRWRYVSCVGVPVSMPYAVPLHKDLAPLAGVVTFSSALPVQQGTHNARLRHVLSKYAELLVEAVDPSVVAMETAPPPNMANFLSDLHAHPPVPMTTGEGWIEFVSGGYVPNYALVEFKRQQTRRKESAQYYMHNVSPHR